MSRFSLASDSFGSPEIEAAIAVLKSGRYTMGEKVSAYESEFAKWTGAKHAVMVNSGSSANLLLIDSLIRRTTPNQAPLQAGDEVLVPALAWPTTIWPLVQLGLKPVFVDSDPTTLAIDLNKAKGSLSDKTKAMFLIHVLGRPAEMAEVTKFCQENGITLVEDCCESLGARDSNKHVGRFGIGGTFSHFFSHHLTTIEGGMVVTDHDDLADDLRSLRAHGWLRDRSDKDRWLKDYPHLDERFFFVSPGYNVRPMEMQAAIGLVQIKRLNEFVEDRQKVAQSVFEIVEKHAPWLKMIGADTLESDSTSKHSWMNIPFELSDDVPATIQQVIDVFERNGVETRPIIAGNITKHPAMNGVEYRSPQPLEHCDRLLNQGFMIGCHPENLNKESLHCVEKSLKEIATL